MASAVQSASLDQAVLRHLCDETTTSFQDVFLIEITDPLPTDTDLPLEFVYGLDSSEEGSIALNLFPLVVEQSSRTQERGAALRSLCAQFRLLRICEHTLNGVLEGVDALLGEWKRAGGGGEGGGGERRWRGQCGSILMANADQYMVSVFHAEMVCLPVPLYPHLPPPLPPSLLSHPGAPVVMCTSDELKSDVFEDLPLVKRQSVCLSLCHCLNWFRELVRLV